MNAQAVAAGDVDADGNVDLVVSGTFRTEAWLGDGAGDFVPALDAFDPPGGDGVVLAELTGDQHLDAAVHDNASVDILAGLGDGTFDQLDPILNLFGLTGIAAEDLDADADVDLALSRFSTGTPPPPGSVPMLENDGTGSFTLHNAVDGGSSQTVGVDPSDIAIGSFEFPNASGNQVPDFAVANREDDNADPSDPLNGIACASASSCTAVGFNGQVLTTTDPELLTWSRQRIGSGPPANRPPLLAVACPADGIRVAGGNGGYIATTTTNWANWSLDQVGSGNGPQPAIAGFGCETPTRCVAVGDTVFAGARAG